jgi:hypothetical protein
MDERLEMFKLAPGDRKVFFWLLENFSIATMSVWIEYTAADYRRRGVATIDTVKFLVQAYEITWYPKDGRVIKL